MRAGLLRVRYWAVDESNGERVELVAETVQRDDGGYDAVLCGDPRAIDAVLELAAGADRWIAVRVRRIPANAEPRVLPTGAAI